MSKEHRAFGGQMELLPLGLFDPTARKIEWVLNQFKLSQQQLCLRIPNKTNPTVFWRLFQKRLKIFCCHLFALYSVQQSRIHTVKAKKNSQIFIASDREFFRQQDQLSSFIGHTLETFAQIRVQSINFHHQAQIHRELNCLASKIATTVSFFTSIKRFRNIIFALA